MSITASCWAWKQQIRPTSKFILMALSDHANDVDFTCWPSLNLLQRKTGYCRKTIYKNIDNLVKLGALERSGKHSSGATLYTLKIDKNIKEIEITYSGDIVDVKSNSTGETYPSNHTDLVLTENDYYGGPSKIPKAQSAKPKNELTEQVSQVFEFWKTTMEHPKAKFDDKRKKIITRALKLGYTVKDLMEAICGCRLSPFHRGQGNSKDGTIHDSLCLILGDAEHIDKFISIYENPPDEFKPKLKDHPKYNMIKRLVNLRRTDPDAYRRTLGDPDVWEGIKESDLPPPGPNELNVIYENKIGELEYELS